MARKDTKNAKPDHHEPGHVTKFAQLCELLEFSVPQWLALMRAADDAHMDPIQYSRLMLLAAAGMGDIAAHANRVADASLRTKGEP